MVKDKILTWFLRNVYLPRVEVIDKSGFILVSSGKVSLRDISFPEYIFIELEKRFKDGTLYTVGKTFGYNYALNTDTPVIGKVDRKTFLYSFYFIVRYIESISYGRDLKHSVDYEKKIFEMEAKDFIICSKNGIGHTVLEGTIAGFCAYAFSDMSIEGVQVKCQGRGDSQCELICAPSAILKQKRLKFASSLNMEDLKIGAKYLEVNRDRPVQSSKPSLKDLIDAGFLKYDHGIIDYKGERFFLCESSIMYILEKNLKKIRGGNEALFDISFRWGARVAKEESEDSKKSISSCMRSEQFVSEFMSALGWGDISIFLISKKYTVSSNYFPWTALEKDIDFVMFRGIFSGLLSGFFNRKIILKSVKTDILQGYFSVTLSE